MQPRPRRLGRSRAGRVVGWALGATLLGAAWHGCFRPVFVLPTDPSSAQASRALIGRALVASALLGPTGAAWGFSPADLGVGSAPTQNLPKVDLSKGKLQEALYAISRVQEATVQQERLVATGKFKDAQRNSITMALNMMLENYKLNDRIVSASAYASPKDNVIKASQAGSEAVDVLLTAQEYFARPLKVSGLTDEQRSFLVQAMQATRDKLDKFLQFMPDDVLQAARKQVEDENDLNMKEYALEGTVMNPVKLPWKK